MALSWCFKDEETPATEEILKLAKRRAIFVPALWYIETSNILGLALRKGRMTEMDLQVAVDTLSALEIHADRPLRPKGFSALLPLMQMYGLTAYDAIYLDLAMSLSLPLATLDQQLIAAAKQAGVPLLAGVA